MGFFIIRRPLLCVFLIALNSNKAEKNWSNLAVRGTHTGESTTAIGLTTIEFTEILCIVLYDITSSYSILIPKSSLTSGGNYYRFGIYAPDMGWGYFRISTTQIDNFTFSKGEGATPTPATAKFYYR